MGRRSKSSLVDRVSPMTRLNAASSTEGEALFRSKRSRVVPQAWNGCVCTCKTPGELEARPIQGIH